MFTKARSPIFESNEGHAMKRIFAFGVGATLAVGGILVSAWAQNVTANKEPRVVQPPTTMRVSEATGREYPIPSGQGPSCIKHLGLTVSQTRMGQMGATGALSANPQGNPQPPSGDPPGPANLNSVIQRVLSTFRSSPEKAGAIMNENSQYRAPICTAGIASHVMGPMGRERRQKSTRCLARCKELPPQCRESAWKREDSTWMMT